jgi:hypothetical protein
MRAAMITRYQQPLEIVNLADPKLPKDGCCQTMRTRVGLLAQPESMRSIVGATQ